MKDFEYETDCSLVSGRLWISTTTWSILSANYKVFLGRIVAGVLGKQISVFGIDKNIIRREGFFYPPRIATFLLQLQFWLQRFKCQSLFVLVDITSYSYINIIQIFQYSSTLYCSWASSLVNSFSKRINIK